MNPKRNGKCQRMLIIGSLERQCRHDAIAHTRWCVAHGKEENDARVAKHVQSIEATRAKVSLEAQRRAFETEEILLLRRFEAIARDLGAVQQEKLRPVLLSLDMVRTKMKRLR